MPFPIRTGRRVDLKLIRRLDRLANPFRFEQPQQQPNAAIVPVLSSFELREWSEKRMSGMAIIYVTLPRVCLKICECVLAGLWILALGSIIKNALCGTVWK